MAQKRPPDTWHPTPKRAALPRSRTTKAAKKTSPLLEAEASPRRSKTKWKLTPRQVEAAKRAIKRHAEGRGIFRFSKKTIDFSPPTDYNQSLQKNTAFDDTVFALRKVASQFPEVVIPQQMLIQLATSALNAATTSLVLNPGCIVDPHTGLTLPPQPRPISYQDRPKSFGRKLTLEQYLTDQSIGWGEYTSRHLLGLFWISEYDRPLASALSYRAGVYADELGHTKPSKERTEASEYFYLKHGILTALHVDHPPNGYEWQAKLLGFARKLQNSLPNNRHNRQFGDR